MIKNILVIIFLARCTTVLALNVILINPDKVGRPFWDLTTGIAKVAADDLGIDLSILYGGGNRFDNLALINKIILNRSKVDYIIFLAQPGSAKQSFELLEKARLPFITLERSFNLEKIIPFGKDNNHFKYWLGEIAFDDQQAGSLLINRLKIIGKDNDYLPISVTALSGDYSAISINREKGLLDTLGNNELNQVIRTLWDPKKTKEMIPRIIKRYPNTNVFWAASDEVALAIQQSLVEHNITKHISIGGIGWLPQAINAIDKGELSVSVGGHFMMGAWALIKVFDHSKGLPSFSKANTLPLLYQAIDKGNVNQYRVLANSPQWQKVDFSQFSLFLNTELTHYNFDLDSVVLALQK